jgi:hypothetical protein
MKQKLSFILQNLVKVILISTNRNLEIKQFSSGLYFIFKRVCSFSETGFGQYC